MDIQFKGLEQEEINLVWGTLGTHIVEQDIVLLQYSMHKGLKFVGQEEIVAVIEDLKHTLEFYLRLLKVGLIYKLFATFFIVLWKYASPISQRGGAVLEVGKTLVWQKHFF